MVPECDAWFAPPDLLADVQVGMAVYDRADAWVGRVREVRLWDGRGAALDHDRATVGDLVEALGDREAQPETRRAGGPTGRHFRIGGAGLFAPDHFATPDQIATVHRGRILLNVPCASLPAA
ncbi:MAG TPA: hypothetical protein VIL85_27755 [Thermomicrobiales bacterium]|jgi:hypothetical protein